MKKWIALALACALALTGLSLAMPLTARGAGAAKEYSYGDLQRLLESGQLVGMLFSPEDVFYSDRESASNSGAIDGKSPIYFLALEANQDYIGRAVNFVRRTPLAQALTLTEGWSYPSTVGYEFLWRVTDALITNTSALTFHIEIEPYLAPITYTITYTDPYKTAHDNPATYTIESAITLKPLADRPDATFLGWFNEATGQQVTAIPAGGMGNISLIAKWKAAYTLTAIAGPGGSITPASARVEEGGSQAFALAPNTGYELDALTVNGAAQTLAPGAASFTLADVRQNSTLHATFAPYVTEVRLAQKALTLAKGKTATLAATADTIEGPGRVEWSSSKPGVVKVVNAANGKIKALKTGKATLTATAENGKKATVNVTVISAKNAVKLTGVNIAGKSSITLSAGKTKILKATPAPKNATGAVIRWSSSKKSVASVDAAGRVTAHKKGTAKITAKIGSKKATVSITVK